MKIALFLRSSVMLASLVGTILVVSSQPGIVKGQQDIGFPVHKIIPAKVGIGQIQEFKDSATLHLNDIQKAMMTGYLGKFPPQRYVVIETVWRSIINTKIYKSDPIPLAATKGGGTGGHQITPAELAILYYVFDRGADMIGKNGSSSHATAEVSPSGISAKISAKDLGMTADQLKQMVAQYCDSHPMRFWNEARVGLASIR